MKNGTKIFTAILLALNAVHVCAATRPSVASRTSPTINVSGRITDKGTNDGLQYATISAIDKDGKMIGNLGATSDKNGYFTLNNVPSDAEIYVSIMGYNRQKISPATRMNIQLERNDIKLEEVFITSNKNTPDIELQPLEEETSDDTEIIQYENQKKNCEDNPNTYWQNGKCYNVGDIELQPLKEETSDDTDLITHETLTGNLTGATEESETTLTPTNENQTNSVQQTQTEQSSRGLAQQTQTDSKVVERARQNYEEARETEQSEKNRLLTGVTTAATGLGAMELAQGLSEQRADNKAQQSMNAYIATMRCKYAGGKSVKAGEEIELPGGNALQYRAEYIALANDLKERKEALGMKPGIESEEILDSSQMGLYDDENVGVTDGEYSSLYRARALNSDQDNQQIEEASKSSRNRVIGGAVAGGAGAVGGALGNSLINGELHELIQSKKDK